MELSTESNRCSGSGQCLGAGEPSRPDRGIGARQRPDHQRRRHSPGDHPAGHRRIPANAAGELFEPFRRLGDDRLAGAGVGPGLSIVRSVAWTHGGEATAASRPGGGLLVRVALPPAPDTG